MTDRAAVSAIERAIASYRGYYVSPCFIWRWDGKNGAIYGKIQGTQKKCWAVLRTPPARQRRISPMGRNSTRPVQLLLDGTLCPKKRRRPCEHESSVTNIDHLASVRVHAPAGRMRQLSRLQAKRLAGRVVEDGEKYCPQCDQILPTTSFNANKKALDGLQPWCKPCRLTYYREHSAKRLAADPELRKRISERKKATSRQKLYGLTPSQFEGMVAAQNNRCAICGEHETKKHSSGCVRSLSVDHDAATGVVRGLLCCNCNVGIGFLNHDRRKLLGAISYLDQHSETEST